MAKGPQFERDMCKQLSLWWSDGARSDVFWRTSGSGARATVRAKKGKETFGQCGDVAAIHPDGVSFLEVFAIELKRGYNTSTPMDLIDINRKGLLLWEVWLWKVISEMNTHHRQGWMIIHKRDSRQPVVWIDARSCSRLKLNTSRTEGVFVRADIRWPTMVDKKMVPGIRTSVGMKGIPFDWFVDNVSPLDIRAMLF